MDKLQIINRALWKCGLPPAAALNDGDWEAGVDFDAAAAEVLRSHAWGFAQNIVALNQAATPGVGFDHAYILPSDCARVIDCRVCADWRSPRAQDVRVIGNKIHCKISPCYLRYVTNSVPPENWPADFCDAVASRIAANIAPLHTQTAGRWPALEQAYLRAFSTARANDAAENNERVPLDMSIYASRGGYADPQGGRRG